MENPIAQLGILIENREQTEFVNHLLHQYGDFIIGRLGVPHRERHVSIISIVMDAPSDLVDSLTGELKKLPKVQVQTQYVGGAI